MNAIFNMAGEGQHIVNFTFVFHRYQYDVHVLSWKYEANELKTKSTVLFGGKQLIDNT